MKIDEMRGAGNAATEPYWKYGDGDAWVPATMQLAIFITTQKQNRFS